MIEKKNEVMPVSGISTKIIFDEDPFLKSINKKKEESENVNSEGITVILLNDFPELYEKKILPGGRIVSDDTKTHKPRNLRTFISGVASTAHKSQPLVMAELVVKNHKPENMHTSASEMILLKHESQALVMTELTASEIRRNEIRGNETRTFTPPLPNPQASVVVGRTSDTRGALKQAISDETMQATAKRRKQYMPVREHTTEIQLKSDFTMLNQKPETQEKKSRASQLPMAERMFQANAGASAGESTISKKSLDLNYPFLRWSGAHSVKVSSSATGNLLLLPSDPRAAETLARQLGKLNGYTAELLNPHQDHEQSENRYSQQDTEEEQE